MAVLVKIDANDWIRSIGGRAVMVIAPSGLQTKIISSSSQSHFARKANLNSKCLMYWVNTIYHSSDYGTDFHSAVRTNNASHWTVEWITKNVTLELARSTAEVPRSVQHQCDVLDRNPFVVLAPFSPWRGLSSRSGSSARAYTCAVSTKPINPKWRLWWKRDRKPVIHSSFATQNRRAPKTHRPLVVEPVRLQCLCLCSVVRHQLGRSLDEITMTLFKLNYLVWDRNQLLTVFNGCARSTLQIVVTMSLNVNIIPKQNNKD